MQNFSSSPRALVASLWKNRALTLALIQREVLGRYRGSFMGLFWSFFNPLLMLAIYTFVFSEVFKSRWNPHVESSKTEFALVLFAGLIAFNMFSECFTRAPSTILSNVNYVKKVIFPLEVLPLVNLGSALFHAFISIAVWLVAYGVFYGLPHLTVLWLPVVLLPLCLLTLGLSWILASLGVFLRDVSQFITILTTALMFLTPIFYSTQSVPEPYRSWLLLNPLTPVVAMVREVLFWGHMPDWGMLVSYLLVCSLIAYLGFAWFQKTRKGFADVL